MKSLILTGLLVLSFSSFADENHDVDCTALDQSRINQKANLSSGTPTETNSSGNQTTNK